MILDLTNSLDKKKAETYFNTLLSNNKKIELKEIKPKRTITQNKYLHVCITLFAIEFGYTLDESKTLLKRECSFMYYHKNNMLFLKRTRDMQTDELTKFIEYIRNYAVSLGCYIPSADEYKENSYVIDKEINKNREYL
jgi:hypothetical protein